MRRQRLGLVAAAGVFALGGSLLGGAVSSGSTPHAGSPAGKKVVYIPGLTGVPFYTTVNCGAALEAKKFGIRYSYQGSPTFGVPEQTSVVNAVVATKPYAIMISITDPNAMIAPLAAAKKAGIKIITIDGDLANKSIGITNIQANGFAGGKLAGQHLAQLIGGKGDVLMIDNATGSTVSLARQHGFEAGIKGYPGIKLLGVQYSSNSVATAAQIAQTTATTNANLKGIFTLETNNTQGAITGLREAGKTKSVKLVGFDTSAPIVAALHSGALQGDVVQYPLLEGELGIQAVVDTVEGKPVRRDQTPPFVFATPANVGSATVQKYIYKSSC